jgi:hypothetical protein
MQLLREKGRLATTFYLQCRTNVNGRPATGGRAVVNGAAKATSGVSALRASIPCRQPQLLVVNETLIIMDITLSISYGF